MVLPYSALAVQKLTAQWVLDLHPEDVFWCSADPGWITGLAYGIFGGFLNGVSSVVYEGRFEPEKLYQILQNYQVSVWYTAPTALRMLRAAGDLYQKFDFSHLCHICTVGEPLEPELVHWTQKVFGRPAHDTYWQTETGAMMIANFPSEPIKPGSMGQPVPGVRAAVLDDDGREVGAGVGGNLVFKSGWPSQMIDIWENPQRFQKYFQNDWFVTGDRAYRDEDGYFWFVGRADDMIKTAGERVGPFEVEAALMSHPDVVEAAVVGKPDPVRGQIIKAFVVLKKGFKGDEGFKGELQEYVKRILAGHAYPREIEFVEELPKTRSGKIIRRILRTQ
jgi:acetyl-CoA synthetase